MPTLTQMLWYFYELPSGRLDDKYIFYSTVTVKCYYRRACVDRICSLTRCVFFRVVDPGLLVWHILQTFHIEGMLYQGFLLSVCRSTDHISPFLSFTFLSPSHHPLFFWLQRCLQTGCICFLDCDIRFLQYASAFMTRKIFFSLIRYPSLKSMSERNFKQ